jgi:hypothetical protein
LIRSLTDLSQVDNIGGFLCFELEQRYMNDKNPNLISLRFVVNGEETVIDDVNLNQPLKVAAEKALKQTSNHARDLSEFQAKYNNADINLSGKVETFNFPIDATIYLSLKIGQGGTSTVR